MNNQHRHPTRNFRPAPAEYDPAKATIEAAGLDLNRVLRAALRWIRDDPDTALATLTPHLPEESPRGRPRRTAE